MNLAPLIAAAISSWHFGAAEISLQPVSATDSTRQLVYRSAPSATPRVLSITVPPRIRHVVSPWADNVAMGLDGAGKLTVVMQSSRGLYWAHVSGSPALHHVPGTTKDDFFPSLFRGTLAFSHAVGVSSTVRTMPLSGGAVRTVWSSAPDNEFGAQYTAIGVARSVAVVLVRDGADSAAYVLKRFRPGRKPKTLMAAASGDALSMYGTSRDGRKLIASEPPRRFTFGF
jgi:hypothetical protein